MKNQIFFIVVLCAYFFAFPNSPLAEEKEGVAESSAEVAVTAERPPENATADKDSAKKKTQAKKKQKPEKDATAENKSEKKDRRERPVDPLSRRVASIFLSESFLNEQIARHLAGSELVPQLKVDFDPESERMFVRGILQVPVDDFRAMGIDPSVARFAFQLTVKPRISRRGNLVLEFPIAETFFYQASSKRPDRDRVVIPVQLLSLGLASTRGYLAALSGDFSSFERKATKLTALLKAIDRSLAVEKNADAIAAMKGEKRSLELQLESTNLQREQFARTAKTLSNILGLTGGEDIDLNNEIKARDNTLILRIKINRIVPYLKDVELAGIRMNRNKRDGDGEDYFIIDINSKLAEVQPPVERKPRAPRAGLKIAPALLIRLNQDIFRSQTVVDARKEKVDENVKDLEITFQDEGVRVSGTARTWLINLPFNTTVDFVSTAPDVFEVRLKELRVLGISFGFMTKYALDAVKDKIDAVLKGICTYEYLGDVDGAKVLRVVVDPKNLIPAFPELHLVDVDVRDRSFMLRIGRAE